MAWGAMIGAEAPRPVCPTRPIRPTCPNWPLAFGVFVLAAAALGWCHRDDIFPPDAAALADNPIARCIAERGAGIDAMAADGTIDAARAKLFKARAEAWCRSRTDQR